MFGAFDVPADQATYRVEVTATRTGFSGLSSSVSSSWTFRSRHVPDDAFVPQRALAARFAPRLSVAGTAPAGRFEVPVFVQEQPGPAAARTRLGKVEVSYDDGATWRVVPVRPARGGWVAVLNQPASGFVSLRASATDSAEGRVRQTIIHAYGLTAR